MTPKSLNDCRNGKEILGYIEKNPQAHVRSGKGSHFIVSTDKGSVAIPYHGHKDIGNGLKHKIIKTLALIGITILLAAWIIPLVRF